MPQDSGAFKTIPRNRSGFRLITAIAAGRSGRGGGKSIRRSFLTSGFLHLRYSRFSLIRSDLAAIAGPARQIIPVLPPRS
jgi:hypothetical protein